MRRAPVLLSSLAVLLALPAGAHGAQRFASPTGSGTACSEAAPCSFRDAVQGGTANDGDEVIVLPGTYGTDGAPVALTNIARRLDVHGATGQPRPVITIAGLATPESAGARATLRDLVLRAPPAGGTVLTLRRGWDATRIRVIAEPGTSATPCFINEGATLSDSACTVAGDGGRAIAAISTAGLQGRTVLRNVTAVATGNSVGLQVFADTTGTHAIDVTNSIVRGGTADIGEFGTAAEAVTITLDHSNYATRQVSGGTTATDPATNANQTAPPLLVDPTDGDVRQQPTSPTVDAGAAVPAGVTDFEDHARTLGAAPDIGADELLDTRGLATTQPASDLTTTSAKLNAFVDAKGSASTAFFEYGTTTAYGNATPETSIGALNGAAPFAQTISGLAPNVTYHARIVVKNAGGERRGADITFTTPAPSSPPTPPQNQGPQQQPPAILLPPPTVAKRTPTSLAPKVQRSRDATFPYSWRISGRLAVPAGTTCGGTVRITVRRATRVVSRKTATVTPACTYATMVTLRSRTGLAKRRGTLKAAVVFDGSTGLNPLAARSLTLAYGPRPR